MRDLFIIFFSLVVLHLPCLLAIGACGLGCKLCGTRHRTKFIITAVIMMGLYTAAHCYEHLEGDPKRSPNYFYCGN